jgi:glycosyltransferase involved in cell wall biosynthesis
VVVSGQDRRRCEAVVAVATFNARATVLATLRSITDSILAYSGVSGAIAVSVVDDASTDDTASRVASFATTCPIPIVLTALRGNRGRGHARNRAVAAVDANVYMFLDHDDEYLPRHVAVCLEAFRTHPRADFVKTGVALSEPVHPDWEPRIAASLTQNLAVRAYCHRLAGGFHEEPEVEVFGNDDVLFNRTVRACGRGVHVAEKTVRFWRRDGNSFDRQLARKFSRPWSEASSTLSDRQRDVKRRVDEIHSQRLREVRARIRRMALLRGLRRLPRGEQHVGY